jgi:hypothetical protein
MAATSIHMQACWTCVGVVPNCIRSLEKPGKGQHLIPLQVLVPSSMNSSSNSSFFSAKKAGGGMNGQGMGGVSSNGGSKSFEAVEVVRLCLDFIF